MARIRSIKPEFFKSLTLGRLPLSSRMTFIGLWTYADDYGRGLDDCRLIRAEIWPLDDRSLSDVEQDLIALADEGLIRRYAVNGKHYLAITNWAEHQKVSHPGPDRFPHPPEDVGDETTTLRTISGAAPETSGVLPPRTGAEQGKEGNREQGKETATPPASRGPLAAAAPGEPAKEDRRGGRGRGRQAPKTPLPDDWAPTDRHREIAKEEGRDCDREAERFRESARAHGRRYADWHAAFTSWLRSDFGRGEGGGAGAVSGSPGGGDPPAASQDAREVVKKSEALLLARRAWAADLEPQFDALSDEERGEIEAMAANDADVLAANPRTRDRMHRAKVLQFFGWRIGKPMPEEVPNAA